MVVAGTLVAMSFRHAKAADLAWTLEYSLRSVSATLCTLLSRLLSSRRCASFSALQGAQGLAAGSMDTRHPDCIHGRAAGR